MLSCDAGKVGPAPCRPPNLGVRKEGPQRNLKEELGAGEAAAGGHFVVDDEKTPYFKSTLLKYSWHPVKFTEF